MSVSSQTGNQEVAVINNNWPNSAGETRFLLWGWIPGRTECLNWIFCPLQFWLCWSHVGKQKFLVLTFASWLKRAAPAGSLLLFPLLSIIVMSLLLSSFLSAGAAVSLREKGRRTRRGTNDGSPSAWNTAALWLSWLLLLKKSRFHSERFSVEWFNGGPSWPGVLACTRDLSLDRDPFFIPLLQRVWKSVAARSPSDKPFCDFVFFFCRR